MRQGDVPFPFDVSFQLKLLKLVMLDGGLVDEVLEHVQPRYFETPELRWVCSQVQAYHGAYGSPPTVSVLRQVVHTAGPLAPSLPALFDRIDAEPLAEEQFLKDHFLEWVRQNVFHHSFRASVAMWNSGKRGEAMDYMRAQMERMERAVWETNNDEWFFQTAAKRELAREHAWEDQLNPKVPTGISPVDKLLQGGLSPGELGIWIAYAKIGKSILLMNHGAQAARFGRRVMHVILEGSKQLIANRYDSYFTSWAYQEVKRGRTPGEVWAKAMAEYQYLHDKLLLVPLLDKWDYTVLDIDAKLKFYKRAHGWVPDVIIVDYGDLLHGRSPPYSAPWMSERDAIRDLKLLANRGYTVWSASQAQRPTSKNYDVDEHVLKAAQIAGGIEKVRVADFVGSINITTEEMNELGQARLYAELARDVPAGQLLYVGIDYDRMLYRNELPAPSPHVHASEVPLGYKQVST